MQVCVCVCPETTSERRPTRVLQALQGMGGRCVDSAVLTSDGRYPAYPAYLLPRPSSIHAIGPLTEASPSIIEKLSTRVPLVPVGCYVPVYVVNPCYTLPSLWLVFVPGLCPPFSVVPPSVTRAALVLFAFSPPPPPSLSLCGPRSTRTCRYISLLALPPLPSARVEYVLTSCAPVSYGFLPHLVSFTPSLFRCIPSPPALGLPAHRPKWTMG